MLPPSRKPVLRPVYTLATASTTPSAQPATTARTVSSSSRGGTGASPRSLISPWSHGTRSARLVCGGVRLLVLVSQQEPARAERMQPSPPEPSIDLGDHVLRRGGVAEAASVADYFTKNRE